MNPLFSNHALELNPRYTVIGSGAWGTAIAIHIALHHLNTYLLCRTHDTALNLTEHRENKAYLAGLKFPDTLHVTADKTVLKGSIALIATPIAGLIDSVKIAYQHQASAIVWLCKGLNADTGQLPHEMVQHTLSQLTVNTTNNTPIGVLSGPSFAKEVAHNLPTALTIASLNPALNQRIQLDLHRQALRIYTSTDFIGVEVGGAVKNIIALACGISDGLNLGFNARAALITRGLAEMTRLTVTLGGKSETLMGLTGIGDLVLTCTGDLSRNRNYGLLLAQGHKPIDIEATLGHVAEGARCVAAVAKRAQSLNIQMPITEAVARIIAGDLPVQSALPTLLAREARAE